MKHITLTIVVQVEDKDFGSPNVQKAIKQMEEGFTPDDLEKAYPEFKKFTTKVKIR